MHVHLSPIFNMQSLVLQQFNVRQNSWMVFDKTAPHRQITNQQTLFVAASTSWNEQDWNSFQPKLCLSANTHTHTQLLSIHRARQQDCNSVSYNADEWQNIDFNTPFHFRFFKITISYTDK